MTSIGVDAVPNGAGTAEADAPCIGSICSPVLEGLRRVSDLLSDVLEAVRSKSPSPNASSSNSSARDPDADSVILGKVKPLPRYRAFFFFSFRLPLGLTCRSLIVFDLYRGDIL